MTRDRVASTPRPVSAGTAFPRLTSSDLMFMRLETAAWPCHFGGLAVLEGKALLDTSGRLRLEEIRGRLDRRVAHLPSMRQRVYVPGPLRGRPLWVDDDRFAIEHHVLETAVESPGGEAELLEAAAQLSEVLLDRSRPLWELWFLTGLSDDRVGVLLKLHHSMADGLAAVAIMGSLFDFEPDAPEPVVVPWAPEPIPNSWRLLIDNVSAKIRTLWRAITGSVHPVQVMKGVQAFARLTRRYFGRRAAPGSSLNRRVQAGRRIRYLRLDLAAMKEGAHAQGGKVNDVVLALWSGGLRHLLMSRGEPVADVELITGLAVSLRSPADTGTIDNEVGTIVLTLPVWAAEVRHRLDLIVRLSNTAKVEQLPAAIMGYMAGLAATPLGRYYAAHQHANNVIVTNVIGPPAPVYLLGARILEILPIIELVGNIGLTLCAFSYAGKVFLVVTADASGFPDLDVLVEGMALDWHRLTGSQISEPVRKMRTTTIQAETEAGN